MLSGMRELAVVTKDVIDTYEYGLLAFTVGETVTVIARALGGPEARTLVRCEAGLVFHVMDEGDLMHDTYPERITK